MRKTTIGVVLLIVGVIGLVAVYSMRPPSGLSEALMMMAEGRQNFIKEPFYQIFMAISGSISLFGMLQIIAGVSGGKGSQS